MTEHEAWQRALEREIERLHAMLQLTAFSKNLHFRYGVVLRIQHDTTHTRTVQDFVFNTMQGLVVWQDML